MRYLFTNKEVKVGDICIALCLKEHIQAMKLDTIFKEKYNSWKDVGRVGMKVVWTSPTRCRGYLVHEVKDQKLTPYKVNNEFVYTTFTTGNNVGLIQYVVQR